MVGKTVTPYRFLERLGGGIMSVVYKAEDARQTCTVAFKSLPEVLPKNQQALEPFRRDARAAPTYVHPNICTVHDPEEVDSLANSKKECVCVSKRS